MLLSSGNSPGGVLGLHDPENGGTVLLCSQRSDFGCLIPEGDDTTQVQNAGNYVAVDGVAS